MRKITRGERRLCLVIDMVGYSRLGNIDQLDAQHRIMNIVRSVCRRARIKLSSVKWQDKGDGVLLVLPVGVDEPRMVAALVLGLRNALHAANQQPEQWGTLRLRAALTQSVVHDGDLGYVGRAVIAASRLVDAPELKSALGAAEATSDLAFIVADDLYQDVVKQNYPGLPSSEFFTAEVALKEYSGTAWITLAPKGLAVDPYANARTEWLLGWAVGGVVVGETALIVTDAVMDLLADHERETIDPDRDADPDPEPDTAGHDEEYDVEEEESDDDDDANHHEP